MYDASIAKSLCPGRIYSRPDIISLLSTGAKSGLSRNSYVWLIGKLVKRGILSHVGTGRYALPVQKQRPVYTPMYSDRAMSLRDHLKTRYPYVTFTMFEMVMMNEFLNHMIAQNTIFIHAQRDVSAFVFNYFKFELGSFALYKPSEKDFRRYWQPDTIVVLDLISQAPILKECAHNITIEKLLVDIYCDKTIQSSYSLAEYPAIIETAYERYSVNTPRLLRYAKRRNKAQEIMKFIPEREGSIDAIKG